MYRILSFFITVTAVSFVSAQHTPEKIMEYIEDRSLVHGTLELKDSIGNHYIVYKNWPEMGDGRLTRIVNVKELDFDDMEVKDGTVISHQKYISIPCKGDKSSIKLFDDDEDLREKCVYYRSKIRSNYNVNKLSYRYEIDELNVTTIRIECFQCDKLFKSLNLLIQKLK